MGCDSTPRRTRLDLTLRSGLFLSSFTRCPCAREICRGQPTNHRYLTISESDSEMAYNLYYSDRLVKCHIPQMGHLYAFNSLTNLFSLINLIISRASASELYIFFLQVGVIGSTGLIFLGLLATFIFFVMNFRSSR